MTHLLVNTRLTLCGRSGIDSNASPHVAEVTCRHCQRALAAMQKNNEREWRRAVRTSLARPGRIILFTEEYPLACPD